MSDKLKKCQKCNSPYIHIADNGKSGHNREFKPVCQQCGASVFNWFMTRELATDWWSTRPREDALRQRIDELEVALEKLSKSDDAEIWMIATEALNDRDR